MTHDRLTAHFGTQIDSTITSLEAVGPVEAGSTLDEVLEYLFAGLDALENPPANVGRFGISAYVHPYLGISAVILGEVTVSLGADAWIAYGGAVSIDAIFRQIGKSSFGISAVVNDRRNLIALTGATYTANANWSSLQPLGAADGITHGRDVGQVSSTNYGWAAPTYLAGNTWWQVTWASPVAMDEVTLWDYDSEGGYFGTDGRLVFSDGSEEPWTGLPPQTNGTFNNAHGSLTITFTRKTGITWMRVVSDAGGSAPAGLCEVMAFDSEET